MDMLRKIGKNELPELESIVCLKHTAECTFASYDQFQQSGQDISDNELFASIGELSAHHVCNLQFTSGTTGTPKAAMLTHS